MKLLFKLLKFGIIIYLLIFFKNLYSETGTRNNIITVRTPDIIDISDIDDTFNEYSSTFGEQMEFFNPETQQKLKQQMDQIKQAQQEVANVESYKDSLEDGINEDAYAYAGSGIVSQEPSQKTGRQLRSIGPEAEEYKLPGVEADKSVPPAIIPIN